MITKVIPTAITSATTKVSECCAFITQTSMKSPIPIMHHRLHNPKKKKTTTVSIHAQYSQKANSHTHF